MVIPGATKSASMKSDVFVAILSKGVCRPVSRQARPVDTIHHYRFFKNLVLLTIMFRHIHSV